MNPHRRTLPAGRSRRGPSVAALLVVVALLLGGCGLRLESPPPTEPDPDAGELVRRTAVADALLVRDQADALASTGSLPPETVAELDRVSGAADAQVTQLGGVYDSGLSDVLGESTVSPSATPSPVPAPADVVATLVSAAGRSSTAADTTEDGPLARLLASVSASHTVSAARLAPLVGVPAATVPAPVVPSPAPADGEEPATTTTSAATTGGATPSTSANSVTTPSDAATTPPGGLSADNLSAIVLAEDAAGYALELRAAREDDAAVRDGMARRAALHRDRAQDWAVLAGTSGTEQDPREVAYLVPGADLTGPGLVQELEDGLATDYATLVGVAEPGTRGILVDLLIDSAVTSTAWGAAPAAFPGLPEQPEPAAA
ncbi:DUF4439 domain-containing protein [Antribacter gilvus]|uniref:DUF4439 domain-containing protein n=1 Tax=Antribacter gilvus TaxID=2304675 RepID=UPI000F78936C|nr:DUF4439 domain-containing protein [Antribacter gilvus]